MRFILTIAGSIALLAVAAVIYLGFTAQTVRTDTIAANEILMDYVAENDNPYLYLRIGNIEGCSPSGEGHEALKAKISTFHPDTCLFIGGTGGHYFVMGVNAHAHITGDYLINTIEGKSTATDTLFNPTTSATRVEA